MGDEERRTHCKNGHELTPENTFIKSEVGKGGKITWTQVCKVCRREYNNRYQRQRREKLRRKRIERLSKAKQGAQNAP